MLYEARHHEVHRMHDQDIDGALADPLSLAPGLAQRDGGLPGPVRD